MNNFELITHSETETEREAERLAGEFSGTETVALFGGMGMGKTAFTRGLARGLGIPSREISSPTFAIMHEHFGRCRMCHYDMYRVETWDELDSTGFPESAGRCVNVVEWSENIENALPLPRWEISISPGDDEASRIIRGRYVDEQGGQDDSTCY